MTSKPNPQIPKVTEAHLGDITQDPHNARKHNPRNIGMIADSLQEVGAARSIVIDENNMVLAGRGVSDGAAQAGIEKMLIVDTDGDTLVAVRRTGLTPEQKTRLALYDNRTTETSEWAGDVIYQIQQDSPQLLDGLFYPQELSALFASMQPPPTKKEGEGGDEFDATPHPEKPTRTQRGDIWKLGEHTLMVGDSGNHRDVSLLMQEAGMTPSAGPSLIVTSPPYGVGKEYEKGGIEEWQQMIQSVFSISGQWCPLWFINLANKRTGNDGYEAHTFGMMVDMFEKLGSELIALRIWLKPPAWATPGPYWRHTYKAVDDFEFLALFGTDKPQYVNRLTEQENTDWGYRGVWQMASVQANTTHAAQFPVELPSRAIRMLTDPHSSVYDPLAGSGTTMTAAHRLDRRAIIMEILPVYADLCIGRAEAEGIYPIVLLRREEGEEGNNADRPAE